MTQSHGVLNEQALHTPQVGQMKKRQTHADPVQQERQASTGRLVRWLARGRRLFDLAGSVVVLMTTLIIGVTLMAGVVVRYFLNGSLAWGSELPVILFPWLVMGGVVMAAARHEHLGVDFFLRKMSAATGRVVLSVMQGFIIILMASLIYQSQSLLMFLQYQSTPVLGWSASWAFYSLPVGAIGVLLLAIIDLIGLVSGRESVIKEMPV
ncbi:TRAP transporter small permease [Kushneria phyllosphaerae]|uniref:TRAP transporter small permease protein n=1 Tax=Kushneria phyllosphaerae TaxID=2100822 RepID=A0A2R8CGP3_9GAMM|nr:TRAP transporter small permease [Kushneria phyllosphaerae]SPJ32033.1 Sialic acid TRAP transporter small permease protein SiaQ [Kushneria phyllosphaerae]